MPDNQSDISNASPLTSAIINQHYTRPPSFTDLLPWMEYLPESKAFLLEDGISLGALFEVTPVGCEARTPAFMTQLRDAIQTAINEAIPERDDGPWVLQIYVQDEPRLTQFDGLLASYPSPAVRTSDYSQHYQSVMSKHLQAICRSGGLFDDTTVTGSRWQGQQRRIRVVLYRRLKHNGKTPAAIEVEEALNDVATKWIAALASAGIHAQRADGEAFYEWLLSWFNPNPPFAGSDTETLSQVAPYPGDEHLPFGYDFAEQLTLSMPRADEATASWVFDNMPHTVVTIQSLRRAPEIGHFTAEHQAGDQVFSLFDRLPEHTVMTMTITIKPQDTTRTHIAQIKRASVGDSAEASLTREDAEQVEREMAQGNKLYPVNLAFYVRGDNHKALRDNLNRLNALLLPNGLQPITQEADLLALDSYIRNLPMAYDVELDKSRRRSRLIFSRHVANLVPFYGRSRGTGHPGLVFYNRGAEPLVFDPLHRDDRKKNAHMLILGPTGAGKSALLVYLLQQMMARHRPRIFIIEAGGSFSLLGQHFAQHGLSVNQITLNPNVDVSLPPFADALRLLDRRHTFNPLDVDEPTLEEVMDQDDEIEEEEGGRDILGEMEIGARIMITGGDEREDARLTRADRLLIRNAIFLAARTVQETNRTQVVTQDVVNAFQAIASNMELPEQRRNRALEMGDGMALFCSGLAGHFFNRPGQPWPEADVTVLEMGMLAREGYEDQLTVAYLSMMSHINDLVERRQHDERPTLVVTDEGHIITTNPLLARYVVKITKMWRKLGAWFWIATQNLEDFPDASRKMLNMMEWWLCLVIPKEEVEQIARFKDLNDEQRSLLLSARKEPGKYVEGVVLADKVEALFRNVPPALSLALAMTEKHEKAARAATMREENCTELEAVYEIARRIEQSR
ncbi:conjugative transfer ATPase [Pseudohalioglobus sediminis]|uniref:Conjugative transfer ATPase n=1 Tax=Pseudohalioglobus sediminis TaxID=2606449 RepID=A0A5B0X3H1_9GAMM|nr:conjugative transfer ATPase [Pseudohalioglobus sediminis]KAA1192709.1 conjugative transfer ATPase [Pseudohalioglobus sediminis]